MVDSVYVTGLLSCVSCDEQAAFVTGAAFADEFFGLAANRSKRLQYRYLETWLSFSRVVKEAKGSR
jgi:hypothetical protein